jgi:glycine/D-amino acid oxidase-like deaminating enzyme
MARLSVIRTFAGLRPWTPDNRPLIGAARERPGYVYATGHEGEGIGLAPITADLVTGLVLGEPGDELADAVLAVADPNRFARTGSGAAA